MGQATEALEVIARVIGSSPMEARVFCQDVQSLCLIPPSFSSIALAVQRYGHNRLPMRTIADEASRFHGLGAENVPRAEDSLTPQNVLPAEDHTIPQSAPPEEITSVYKADLADEDLKLELESLAESITRQALGKLIAERIEGKVIGFTGNSPYPQEALERFAMKLGATPDDADIEWDDLEWIVIGREDLDGEYLENSIRFESIEYFTQEEFLGRVFFGTSTLHTNSFESYNASHPGVRFVHSLLARRGIGPRMTSRAYTSSPATKPLPPPTRAMEPPAAKPPIPPRAADPTPTSPPNSPILPASTPPKPAFSAGQSHFGQPPPRTPAKPEPAGFNWPDLYSSSGHEGHQEEPYDLKEESDLKRLGYSVAKGVSVHERHEVLDYAVRNLGLRRVAKHLAWLIRFHRNNPMKHDAVEHWEEDFEWLRSRHRSRH